MRLDTPPCATAARLRCHVVQLRPAGRARSGDTARQPAIDLSAARNVQRAELPARRARRIASFALVGRGTPAPFDAPREFVAAGPYRWVQPVVTSVESHRGSPP